MEEEIINMKSPESGNNSEKEPEQKRFKGKRIIALAVFSIVALAAGVLFFIYSVTYVSTDDAYIESHSVKISSKVPGNAIKLYFDDNQKVQKGQLLLQIDTDDYKVRNEQATAAVEGAKAQISVAEKQILQSKANLEQINAEINSIKAEYSLAEADLGRYAKLYETNAASKQDLDRAMTNYKSVKSKLDSYAKKASAAQQQVSISSSQHEIAMASIKQLKASVKKTNLDLSYTKIYAPASGIVTVKSVEEGDYIQTGQPLLSIVPDKRWIVANFKETQLTNMKQGQPVSIKIDAYPDKKFIGRVDSIQSSTGSATSLFPPENAVGSFVKVVQRVPVKIVFTEKINSDYVLVPGMSVIPEVKVK